MQERHRLPTEQSSNINKLFRSQVKPLPPSLRGTIREAGSQIYSHFPAESQQQHTKSYIFIKPQGNEVKKSPTKGMAPFMR